MTLTGSLNVNNLYCQGSITLEGTTENANEITLTLTDPTTDRTITFPDNTGMVCVKAGAGLANAEGEYSVNQDLTISGGTVNNTVIGGTVPADATFHDATVNNNLTVTGAARLNKYHFYNGTSEVDDTFKSSGFDAGILYFYTDTNNSKLHLLYGQDGGSAVEGGSWTFTN